MIPKRLLEKIDYVVGYVGTTTNDWFRVKMEIINSFPVADRSLFSRRHYSTKKHILNSFDKEVINYWEKKTGVRLFIDPEKLHPEDWVHRPRGWKLKELSEERKAEKKAKKSH